MSTSLARWQFAITSIYHFFFVPITIGLAFLVALLQTMWHRSGDDDYRRLTRFFGTILLINVAVGVVTGLVQEFEFGMNWSAYSAYVGNIFGGPLAMEGLLAFFLESTFLGIWIFGWNRLPKRVHLACIWAVSFGTAISAAFIMAANSWMQHPVGYVMNTATNQPQLNDIWALFTNPVFLWGYVHVLLASAITGALVMLSISAWHLRRQHHVESFRRSATISLIVLVPAAILIVFVGSELGVIEAKYQPMKIAAAEAQWNACQPCSFSLLQVGGASATQPTKILKVPHALSVLATNSWNGKVEGLTQLNQQYQAKYGPGNYIPNVFIQYWSMRVMAYLAVLVLVFAVVGLVLIQRRKLEHSRRWLALGVWAVITPFLMNLTGWMLTENGRQPWIVQGLMLTSKGVSPSVSATDVWISLVVFLLVFIGLGIADGWLMIRYGRKDLTEETAHGPTGEGGEGTGTTEGADEMALVY